MDIFDILGPVMVGPSQFPHSGRGPAIGAMARTLLGEPVTEAKIHLYGSFAETGRRPRHGPRARRGAAGP